MYTAHLDVMNIKHAFILSHCRLQLGDQRLPLLAHEHVAGEHQLNLTLVSALIVGRLGLVAFITLLVSEPQRLPSGRESSATRKFGTESEKLSRDDTAITFSYKAIALDANA